MYVVIEIGDNQYNLLIRGGALPIIKEYVVAVLTKSEARTLGVAVPQPLCPMKTPEPHLAGEFPMTCHQCHLVADS